MLPKKAAARAEAQGAKFYDWPVPAETPDLLQTDEMLIRLVTSFATTADDVDRFLAMLA